MNRIPLFFPMTYEEGENVFIEAMKELFGCEIYKDYGGNDRVAVRLI